MHSVPDSLDCASEIPLSINTGDESDESCQTSAFIYQNKVKKLDRSL